MKVVDEKLKLDAIVGRQPMEGFGKRGMVTLIKLTGKEEGMSVSSNVSNKGK